jgi:hypothetical protein
MELAWMMMMMMMMMMVGVSLSLIKKLDSLQRTEIIDVFKRSGIL